MTPALLLVRDCIIYSVNVWLVPVECAFNMIESELVRRGVQLYPDANGATVRAPSRLTQDPGTIGTPCAAISRPNSRTFNRSRGHRKAEARHAIHIRPNSRRAVPDRAEGTSAREPGAVSRRSVLSTRARGSVDSQIPLRGYFLWVGGALLVLLFAADSLLPAPLPSKLIELHFTRPPIRITSDLRGPEAVVIDTSQPDIPACAPGQGDCRCPLAAAQL